ncbi:MAG: glycosyltransferase family 4 protein [Gammaproteobacteria bacterium]|jgi:glycosyltransferase involved in cell wall biosynthesis|nr:glycosyltransferase family 4 protein [Gammaproteobacteria bacterium]
MTAGPAIVYATDGYDTAGARLLGRQAAGEGLLRGLARFSTAEVLYACTRSREEFEAFRSRIAAWAGTPRQVGWVPVGDAARLREAGLLYRPDPTLADAAWARRTLAGSSRAYSLCGVTHTIASRPTLRAIGDLLLAPVEPWDALICTSQAVRTAVDRVLGDWSEHLAQRFGGRPPPLPQLPVIPLGIDCDAFPPREAAAAGRERLRRELGIADADVVALFVGRLIFYAKAHPVPMYLALERAAQTTGRKVHLIQAGWFEEKREEEEFQRTARVFAPSVRSVFLDGRRPEIRRDVWYAADLFVSLSDNIQETFGLTPVEAMAAGLPAVVSDWDGYRESVRHGVDGLRVPTVTPPPGSAEDLAAAYLDDRLSYSAHVGHAAMAVAVDVDACAQALATLMVDPALRRRMGDSGRARARAVYDWKVVVAAYEALWRELALRRTAASEGAEPQGRRRGHPLCDDPFYTFGHYPTIWLGEETLLGAGEAAGFERLQEGWSTAFGAGWRAPQETLAAVTRAIAEGEPLTVGEILRRFGGGQPLPMARLRRGLAYLLKFDVLRLARVPPPADSTP